MSGRLKSIHIKGFKKFKDFHLEFNREVNILVGENEAGKTTILEAIKIVLNQSYRLSEKAYLEDLFNKDLVNQFKENPSIDTLPSIYIELEFDLDSKDRNSENFFGEHNCLHEAKYGISFTCCFDEESWGDSLNFSEINEVPYEFYRMEWKNFSGRAYNLLIKPLRFLFLDTNRIDRNASYNYYNRSFLHTFYEEEELLHKKNNFRSAVIKSFNNEIISSTKEKNVFGIDTKKLILDNVISILNDGVPVENHGSGMENLIKTRISLNRANNINVVLLEEPENHLSFVNLRKMINEINEKRQNVQLIISTHSSMVATRLDLRNVLWITEGKAKSLKNVNEDDANFFIKLARNSFLQMLLAERIILVEGITEYLLIPEFYKKIYNKTLEEDNIIIVSCEGVSYKRYLAIAKATNKKAIAITDNDYNTNPKKLDNIYSQNDAYERNQKACRIFTSAIKEQWTWELCLYHTEQNQQTLNDFIYQEKCTQINNDNDYIKFFKSQKADFAYQILRKNLIAEDKLKAPDYIREALKWVRK